MDFISNTLQIYSCTLRTSTTGNLCLPSAGFNKDAQPPRIKDYAVQDGNYWTNYRPESSPD